MKKVQTKNKTKGLFGIFATLALAVGVGVSLAPREVVKTEAAETTYTHTFTAKTFDANNQTKKLSNVDWLVVNNGGYYGYDATKGQQFGSGGNPAKSLTLSSTGFPGTIKTVKVSTAGAKDVDADVLVKVGSTSYGSAETISDSNTEYVFTGTSSGKLEIVWEQTSSKALYVKTIIVVYEEPEPKVLESIVVTTQPTKKNYYVGDTFDKTGMVVTAYYDDETDEEVSNDDVTVTPNIMALDVTSVEVDYEGEKATISGISVEPAPTVESLEVTGTLVKSEYTEGTNFDPTGLVVTAHFSNSTTLDVTSLATYSPSPLTMDTTEVTISYGGKSATVGVTVTEYVAQVGVYTIKSNITSGADYNADPGLDKFDVTKTNNDQEMFVLGDKLNFRVGASPNVTDIMLGHPSTAPTAGKVSFTMPAGVYVTAITLHDLQVSDGALTVNVNGGTEVSLNNNSTHDELVFNTYTNKVTINTSKRLWINSISIETALVKEAAEHYADLFLDATAAQCLAGSVLVSNWNNLGAIYSGMDSEVKAQFSGVLANAAGSVLEQFVARYTYIAEKYGYHDFMDLGIIQDFGNKTVNKISNKDNLITFTVLIGVISLTTLGGVFFIKRKKVKSN